MARPRCEDCGRFARFLVRIGNFEGHTTCKACGRKQVKAARLAGEDVQLYEAFDRDWQPIIWREAE